MTAKTLGELRQSGYISKSIKQELRDNLITHLQKGTNPFEGIYGYDDSVIPELQRAILSGHNVLLLGLRGQAKTRIARLMTRLLDEYIPVLEGTELNDDPLHPISKHGQEMVATLGDKAPISWWHRDDRYTEKLATPDVTVADLIGDVDPIKAANLKLNYSDERVIHFGLIPRSHRGLFVINELPDLQARIQVSLFNILQEGDIQIRGFKIRLPLDIQFVFTANPEDYTNRGSIVTPLKDRIESQILTHYPSDIETSARITLQEARGLDKRQVKVYVPELASLLIEQIAMEARASEYVDSKSGVSARLTITALENLVSAAERRALINGEKSTTVRITDFWGIIPAITGKIELVYEGEQEGSGFVAQALIGKAIRTLFTRYYDDPNKAKKAKTGNPYEEIARWYADNNETDLLLDDSDKTYAAKINAVKGLKGLTDKKLKDIKEADKPMMMEFLLHGLAEFSVIGKARLGRGTRFNDLLSGMLGNMEDED